MKIRKRAIIGFTILSTTVLPGCADQADDFADEAQAGAEGDSPVVAGNFSALQASAVATPGSPGAASFGDGGAKITITSNNKAEFYFIRMGGASATVRGVTVSLLCTLGSYRQFKQVSFGDIGFDGVSALYSATCSGGAISRATLSFSY